MRQAWPHEAHYFTPWLADNLDRLGAAIGIPGLESEDTEVRVGPFRADIVARTSSETKVLIENQLAGADLQHLGQVLAYLAGLDAKIVIWVATGFHDSYLAAIRWLNEHTEQPYSFFAVRVRVAQIRDSKLAPVFEVLERPNEWVDDIRHREQHGGGLTQLGQFRRDFWEHFAENSDTRPRLKGPYAASSVHYKVEGTGLAIVQALSKHGNWDMDSGRRTRGIRRGACRGTWPQPGIAVVDRSMAVVRRE